MGRAKYNKVKPQALRVRHEIVVTTRGIKVKVTEAKHIQNIRQSISPRKKTMTPARAASFNTFEAYDIPENQRKKVNATKMLLSSPVILRPFQYSQNDYMREFLPRRDKYVSLMLDRYGSQVAGGKCRSCDTGIAQWRCLDCFADDCRCRTCFSGAHKMLPFHRVQRWTGTHFTNDWLSRIGVQIHLGHAGEPCPAYDPNANLNDEDFEDVWLDCEDEDETGEMIDDMVEEDEAIYGTRTGDKYLPNIRDEVTIVDLSGIHQISVRPCSCPQRSAIDEQYLAMGLFPASFTTVKTAFTFDVLVDQRLDNLESKTAVLRYWNKLKRKTSSFGLERIPVGHKTIPRLQLLKSF